tara:strand:- start:420 stop:896 length:477 start_codon:yes stop_codon:yes gene_type:complete
MYLTIKANEFDQNNILINNKTKNNIMNNSDFFRILYSDDKITFNGIYIHFILENLNIEKYFNKVKCCFQNNIYNNDTINEIINIEKFVLNKINYDLKKYTPIYRMKDQLQQYFIKIFIENNKLRLGKHDKIIFVLKISGIWANENNKTYGITFRFYII